MTYNLGDVVSVYGKTERFRIMGRSEDLTFYRLVGLDTKAIYTVNHGALMGKIINYHHLWDDLCQNE